ncbi:hypothetical protein SNOG_07694 [Parastagonospora nodorum SN15]|uniref:Uncharacterized protein n=1 Tax=Phaeosphaeria nodorum (strain SN15 / ATCC MYA-4574 / FGSC 10173) TaxID=321614 RepID=Q0UKM0_PHANO|nr:hypothetical protein SNOG_07694 [Parastagonospora nodorum SN15]EAT85160.1 hypothetical protein SNOG_07694 [Parastagonospora nodorum SN15]
MVANTTLVAPTAASPAQQDMAVVVGACSTTVDHPQRQPPPIPCADAHPHCQSSKRPPRLQTDLLGPPILNGPVRHAPPSKASDPGPWQHRPFGNRPSSQPTAVNATALRHPSCATNVCF